MKARYLIKLSQLKRNNVRFLPATATHAKPSAMSQTLKSIASMHAQLHQRTRSNNIHAHAQLHQHSNIHTHARLARNTNFILAIAFLGAGRGREYGSMSNSRACHVKHHAS